MSKPLDSGKNLFDTSINADQIGLGFEADTRGKMNAYVNLKRLSDKCLVKKLLTCNQMFWLLVNNFFIRSLSVSRIQ